MANRWPVGHSVEELREIESKTEGSSWLVSDIEKAVRGMELKNDGPVYGQSLVRRLLYRRVEITVE